MGVAKPEGKKVQVVTAEMLDADRKLVRIVELSDQHKNKVKTIYEQLRMEGTKALLADIPVEELNRDKSGIRVATLRSAGYENIGQLVGVSAIRLKSINGIGEEAAGKIVSRVYEINKAMAEGARVKISADDKNINTVAIINSVAILMMADSDIERANQLVNDCHAKIQAGIRDAKDINNPLKWLFTGKEKKSKKLESFAYLEDLYNKGFAKEADGLKKNCDDITYQSRKENTWADFVNNSAPYFAFLEKIIDKPVVDNSIVTGLPDRLAREIDAFPLNTSLMKATLRSYQEFGAKYALHQKRALLGDEMGLGKTMQAIATMAHLATEGKTHFMVVCPVSVMVNWSREIQKHSELKAIMVHGSDRGDEFDEWQENGGVAVTTYETISRLELPDTLRYDSLVVDEAHYVKNPQAIRTKALAKFAEKSEYVLFMTGTPIENKVEEMIFIISMLNTEISNSLKALNTIAMAPKFRETIAPVYLRRVREDVLTELPEMEEKEEWCQMTAADMSTYKNALVEGNFMKVRQVSWNTPDIAQSSKANRLKEICDQAADEGRKVIVFSFFLDTIKRVQELMGDRCFGPIDGSIAAGKRQEIVDQFSEGPAGSVLVSQIIAGGVGLNIQSASVVIICEPQWKPSTENQAISRAYRMGQARNVLVRRLLADETVDEEILNILKGKTDIFNNFADESAIDEANKAINENKAMATIVQSQMEKYGLTTAEQLVADQQTT